MQSQYLSNNNSSKSVFLAIVLVTSHLSLCSSPQGTLIIQCVITSWFHSVSCGDFHRYIHDDVEQYLLHHRQATHKSHVCFPVVHVLKLVISELRIVGNLLFYSFMFSFISSICLQRRCICTVYVNREETPLVNGVYKCGTRIAELPDAVRT